jgi:YNFM family putative membrane transporter
MRPLLILITTVLTIAILYAPQPLLPVLAEEFLIRESTAALLVSLALAPLGLAPLCYGFFLEAVSATKLLRISILLLALSGFAFAACNSFALLLATRIFQGLVIPAVLTSLMTTISIHTPKERLQRAMSFYIAATITGGFLGRLCAGIFTSLIGWRLFFVMLGSALFLCFMATGKVKGNGPVQSTRPEFKTMGKIVLNKNFLHLFLVVFSSFFVLASVMNFIPFRVLQIDSRASEILFGCIYTGYLAGIFSSLMSGRIIIWCKSEKNAIIVGILLLGMSLLSLLLASISLIIITLFVLSASMFLVHTIAANKVNQMAETSKGMVNGLYVAFYYMGGTLGSYLPGLIYEKYNWTAFICVLLTMTAFGLCNAVSIKNRE